MMLHPDTGSWLIEGDTVNCYYCNFQLPFHWHGTPEQDAVLREQQKVHFDSAHGALPADWNSDWQITEEHLQFILECGRCGYPFFMALELLSHPYIQDSYKKAHRRLCNPETHTYCC